MTMTTLRVFIEADSHGIDFRKIYEASSRLLIK
jgi:hypothetical protein